MIGKMKTTRKQLNRCFSRIFWCGYCDLQYILHNDSPKFYNCGIYGWNYNVYDLGNIAITTGYRGMFGTEIPRELIHKYEAEAKPIVESTLSWKNHDEYVAKMNDIRDRFINEIKQL